MTKQTNPTAPLSTPLSAVDFTLALFCRVDGELKNMKKLKLAHLHPSETVTLGVLQVL